MTDEAKAVLCHLVFCIVIFTYSCKCKLVKKKLNNRNARVNLAPFT